MQNKIYPNWKKVKLSLFANDILKKLLKYIKKSETLPKIYIIIKEFSKVAAYNISIQNSVALLHTNNKLLKREIKKTILFTIA